MAQVAPLVQTDITRPDPLAVETCLQGLERDAALGIGDDDMGRRTLIGDGAGFDPGSDERQSGVAGQDILYGGRGLDEMVGGFGDAKISGGKGADMLNGFAGRDAFLGGTGLHPFFFADKIETDVIRDFNARRAGEKSDLILVIGIEDLRDLRANPLNRRDVDISDADQSDFIFSV